MSSLPKYPQPSPSEPRFDPQLCRQCRGLCCQGYSGVWVDPQRFARSFFPQGLPERRSLPRQLARLDLELRDIAGVAVPAPRRDEFGCIFLDPEGCRLPASRRPCQCLALEPSLETLLHGEIHCRLPAGFGGAEASKRWQAYWRRT